MPVVTLASGVKGLIAGAHTWSDCLAIQNDGAANVRICFDGTDGSTLSDTPGAEVGIELAARSSANKTPGGVFTGEKVFNPVYSRRDIWGFQSSGSDVRIQVQKA